MIRNKNQFLINSEIYHIDTRQFGNFHQTFVNLTKYQKGVYYLVVKMFNLLTPNVNYSGRTAPLTSKVAFYIFIQQI